MGQGWRTAPLPKGWPRTRRRILRRDAGVCHICRRPGAQEVDHLVPAHLGGADDDENLAAVHTDCHRRKTAREARAAQPNRRRPAEPHPGMVKRSSAERRA